MTRKECLDRAAECVLRDRNNEYGKPEDCFGVIANFWSVYLGRKVYPHDVAMMMALLKVARIKANKGYADGYVDLAGYAACGAELAGRAEAYRQSIEESGAEYKKLRAKAEAEGDAEGWDQLTFKAGDAVEWFSFGRKDAAADGWHPAFYLCRAGDRDYHVVQDIDGMYHVVNYANIRSPEAMYRPGDKVEALSFDGSRWEDAVVERTEHASTGWHCTVRLASGERHCLPVKSIRRPSRAEGCEEPEFKRGDKVQFRDEIPSTSEPHWFEGVYVERLSTGGHAVKFGPHGHVIHCSDKDIRPAPKAEGCEELVQDEAEECRDCDGFQDGSAPKECEGCMKTLEADAPQTPHDLYKRIIDANPATFHTPSYAEEQLDHHSRLQPHKPTGEELAEMAEEDAHE